MLFHILRYKLVSYVKASLDVTPSSIIRGAASLAIFGAFGFGIYSFTYAATSFILGRTLTGLYLFHTFISMALFVFFLTVNLGNVIVSYATLYRSPEVEFLFTKPVSFTSVFILKFLDNFFYSSTTLFVAAFMALLGYGTYFGYSWYYYIAIMVFMIIPFMFLSASLAVIILMGVMKLAGKIGFRKVMSGLFVLYIFITYLFFNSANPVSIVENIGGHFPDIDNYVSNTSPGFLKYLPNQWVADLLYYIAHGEAAKALPYLLGLLSATGMAFGLSLVFAKGFYYKSWLISLKIRSDAQSPRSLLKKRFLDFRSRSFLPSQIEVLFKKEFFAFFREPSQWIHLVVMIILTFLFSASVGQIRLNLRILDVQIITYMIIFAFSGFMICSLALRFAFPEIGLEGKAFWMLRTSPVKESKIFFVKFIIAFFLVLVLAEYITVSGNMPFVKATEMRPLLLWFGIFNAFWISLATVSLNLGFGGYFANYLELNPIRAASSQGATLTFLATLIYLVIITVIVFVPLSTYLTSLFRFRTFQFGLIVIPGTLFAVFSYIIAAVGFWTGLRSMRRDF